MNREPIPSQHVTDAAQVEVPAPIIDMDIYVMPAFATLSVSDLDRSRHWYVAGLGFALLAEVPGPSGSVALLHVRRWRYQDLLLVPARHPIVATARGIRLTFSAHGADLDALVARARMTPGGTVEGPTPTPWNTLDVVARDLDGYEIVFTTQLPAELRDPMFAERMEHVRQQVLTEQKTPTA